MKIDDMDITQELLKGASPYLSKFCYNALKREVVLITVDNPEGMSDLRKVVFEHIIKYSEVVDGLDDDLIDSVVGIHWIGTNKICIRTEIREAIITLSGKPYSIEI